MNKIFTLLKIVMSETRSSLAFQSILLIILAVTEVMGLIFLFPFLKLITIPEYETNNEYIYFFKQFFSLDYQSLVICMSLVIVTYIVIANLFKSWIYYRINYYVEDFRTNLSSLLFKSYMNRRYSYFISNSSSKITKYLLSEVDTLVDGLIRRIIFMSSHLITLVAILLYLVYVDIIIAINSILILSLLYIPLYMALRKRLSRLGFLRSNANEKRFQSANEAFRGIKDVILNAYDRIYTKKFTYNVSKYSVNIAKSQIYNMLPNFLVEAILFSFVIGFLVFATLYLSYDDTNIATGVPYAGVFFMALYKLKPAIQNILGGFSAIRFNLEPMNYILSELVTKPKVFNEQIDVFKDIFPLRIKNLSYRYESRKENALTNVNIEICNPQSIAIVGKTGSGKSTFLDLFCGLLHPTSGEVIVNDTLLSSNNISSFRNFVSYLPQEVFIAEANVIENIALGCSANEIDFEFAKQCAKQACIYDFIENDLPDGFDTFLGENGCHLSGGQKQRIGLARAIYKKPQILILDEGTNALDSHTETLVLKSLTSSQIKVLINVTHRLKTLDLFDRVLFLSDGLLIKDCKGSDFSETDLKT